MSKQKYTTDIEVGKRYRDSQTDIEGVVTAVTFHQFGCERVLMESVVNGKIEEFGFDAPRLVRSSDGKPVTTERTGGPERGLVRRPSAAARQQ